MVWIFVLGVIIFMLLWTAFVWGWGYSTGQHEGYDQAFKEGIKEGRAQGYRDANTVRKMRRDAALERIKAEIEKKPVLEPMTWDHAEQGDVKYQRPEVD